MANEYILSKTAPIDGHNTHSHINAIQKSREKVKKENFFNFQSEMNLKRTSHEIVDYVHALEPRKMNESSNLTVESSLNKFGINVGEYFVFIYRFGGDEIRFI